MEVEKTAVVVWDERAAGSEGAPAEGLYSLADVDVSGSLVGLKAKSLEEFDLLYSRHAKCLGFSARKSTQRKYGSTGDCVKEKYFCCSCAGFSKATSAVVRKRKRKQLPFNRTGCKASIRVKLNNEGLYEVIHHVTVHNHALTVKPWEHGHLLERCRTNKKMVKSGMKSSADCHYESDVVADGSVDCTLNDNLIYGSSLIMKPIEGDDAQTVIDLLYEKADEDPNFFFRCKLDSMGKVSCLFWRDSRMKEDYQIYGDVVVLDTTCRTNKYNLICASFVGINNHWKNVMFGCAFLSNENVESFLWLFGVFKKSMGGACPVSIFTDEDNKIAKAVEKVFPQSRHRLYLWYLEQNAMRHAGELQYDSSFRDCFAKCLKGCTNEEDFQSCWRSMISKYELQKNSWFTRLYQLRDKWCMSLSKDFFSAGILSSQRGESANFAVGFQVTETTSLTEFFWIFKSAIKRWRKTEVNDEYECSTSCLRSGLPMASLLKHAAEIYTITLFKDFEKEFGAAMGTKAELASVVGDSRVYEVSPDDDLGSMEQVTYSCVNNSVSVSCSCKNFEESGWLCYHCIKILHVHSVSRIPEQYITPRWTKNARKEVWDMHGESESSEKLEGSSPWRHMMARNYYSQLLKYEDNEQARRILEDGYHRMEADVEALFASGHQRELDQD